MTEDDTAFIDGNYKDFPEGEVVSVPDWVGRSFKDKGTAVDPEEGTEEDASSEEADETFANPDERETKAPSKDEGVLSAAVEVPDSAEAERTTENSHWWQFRGEDGDLVLNEDGDPFKVPGAEKRDAVLDEING